jgi:hypothetical protein
MSSSSRMTWAVIQLAFGILLLGDHFWSASARADWKKEWEKTLAAAKKEGQVVLLMRRYEGVFAEFRKEYPEIKVVTITGRGSDLGNRIVAAGGRLNGAKFGAGIEFNFANKHGWAGDKGASRRPCRQTAELPTRTRRRQVASAASLSFSPASRRSSPQW